MMVPFGNDYWLRAFVEVVGLDSTEDEALVALELVEDPDPEALFKPWDCRAVR